MKKQAKAYIRYIVAAAFIIGSLVICLINGWDMVARSIFPAVAAGAVFLWH